MVEKVKEFEELEVWQLGRELVKQTYMLCTSFPKEELFGIVAQMKRAALSVPANLAEGFGRYHYLDKAKFYLNARGSLYELKSHLLIAQELGFSNSANSAYIFETIDKLAMKINNLINVTRAKAKNKSQPVS